MSIALGATFSASATSQAGGSGGSAVALQAQLDRCTKQLGDWVDCSSGKTPEGKQIIQALQEKISSIKQQIQTSDSAKSSSSSNSGSSSQSGAATGSITPPVSLALASLGSVGTILNAVA